MTPSEIIAYDKAKETRNSLGFINTGIFTIENDIVKFTDLETSEVIMSSDNITDDVKSVEFRDLVTHTEIFVDHNEEMKYIVVDGILFLEY